MLGGTQKQITIGNYRKQDKKRTKTKHKRKKKSKFSRKRDGGEVTGKKYIEI